MLRTGYDYVVATSIRPTSEPLPERAISLLQPWATLVVVGAKCVETRPWRTTSRGLLGVHASKGFSRQQAALCLSEPFCSVLAAAGFGGPGDLPLGALLGSVSVTDCVPTDTPSLEAISDQERAFGDYSPGRWAWLLEGACEWEEVPCKGALSLWRVPDLAGLVQRKRSA